MSEFVEGNYEDKYNSKNPISRLLMNNFLKSVTELLKTTDLKTISSIAEVGVGEGELLKNIIKIFPKAKYSATDLSKRKVKEAENNLKKNMINFSVQNAEKLLKYRDNEFDLVICCEVLEHVKNYKKALKELRRISNKYILLSVPNEPVWRVLNMARGKYLSEFGNTPGHINHWNIISFEKLVKSEKFLIIDKKYPFPWQMMLLKVIEDQR